LQVIRRFLMMSICGENVVNTKDKMKSKKISFLTFLCLPEFDGIMFIITKDTTLFLYLFTSFKH